MTCTHTIHKHDHHLGWDNTFEPVLSVKPGETIAVETIDGLPAARSPHAALFRDAGFSGDHRKLVRERTYGHAGA